VTEATANAFAMGDLEADLVSIPGVGPKSAEKLAAAGIKNSFNLVGKFLCVLDEDKSTQENCVSALSCLQERCDKALQRLHVIRSKHSTIS